MVNERALRRSRLREKALFFDLADRLAHAGEGAEQQRLKEELARMTFGERRVARGEKL